MSVSNSASVRCSSRLFLLSIPYLWILCAGVRHYMLTLNLSCAQPGERHHLNLTTARPFLTLVEIVAAMDFLRVPEGVWDRFLQNMRYQKIPLRFDVNI